jgi:hypothetical protein
MKYLIILLSYFIVSCNFKTNLPEIINPYKTEFYCIGEKDDYKYIQFVYFMKDSCSWITNSNSSFLIHDPKCKNHETKCKH